MPAPRRASNNGKNGSSKGPVKPFKYRSITDIEKKRVLEIRRNGLEADHYGIEMQIEVLQDQPLGPNDTQEERDLFISKLRENQAILESMIRSYGERIADIDAALVAEKE